MDLIIGTYKWKNPKSISTLCITSSTLPREGIPLFFSMSFFIKDISIPKFPLQI